MAESTHRCKRRKATSRTPWFLQVDLSAKVCSYCDYATLLVVRRLSKTLNTATHQHVENYAEKLHSEKPKSLELNDTVIYSKEVWPDEEPFKPFAVEANVMLGTGWSGKFTSEETMTTKTLEFTEQATFYDEDGDLYYAEGIDPNDDRYRWYLQNDQNFRTNVQQGSTTLQFEVLMDVKEDFGQKSWWGKISIEFRHGCPHMDSSAVKQFMENHYLPLLMLPKKSQTWWSWRSFRLECQQSFLSSYGAQWAILLDRSNGRRFQLSGHYQSDPGPTV